MKSIYGQLFWSFFKIGGFTFGGGWAMISLIEKEIVDHRKWIERTEFLDLLAIAQSLPGILAVNVAVAVGDKLKGKRGSLCAATGTIILPFLMILTIAIFLTPDMIKNNPTINHIFMGIRPAVVALIIAPVITSARSAKIKGISILIPVVVALLIWSGWPYISNPILYILIGGAAGWYFTSRMSKKAAAAGNNTDDDNKKDNRQ